MPTDPLPPTRILLLGLMGSGKTAVGHALAARTGWPYLDNDDRLAQTTGTSLTEYAERGQQALHDLEARLAKDLLQAPAPLVGGVAASAGDRSDLLARLRAGAYCVYLRASVETLLGRVGDGAGRPWLSGDARGFLADSLRERGPAFHAAAHLTVDVDADRPERIAQRIATALPVAG